MLTAEQDLMDKYRMDLLEFMRLNDSQPENVMKIVDLEAGDMLAISRVVIESLSLHLREEGRDDVLLTTEDIEKMVATAFLYGVHAMAVKAHDIAQAALDELEKGDG